MSDKRVRADICPICDGVILAPQSMDLHVKRSHPDAVKAVADFAARVRARVEALPPIVMRYPPDDPVHRVAVLAILDDEAAK